MKGFMLVARRLVMEEYKYLDYVVDEYIPVKCENGRGEIKGRSKCTK